MVKKKKVGFVETFNTVFTKPMVAVMCGFGLFWLYRVFSWNVWICIIVGMYATSLITSMLFHKLKGEG